MPHVHQGHRAELELAWQLPSEYGHVPARRAQGAHLHHLTEPPQSLTRQGL